MLFGICNPELSGLRICNLPVAVVIGSALDKGGLQIRASTLPDYKSGRADGAPPARRKPADGEQGLKADYKWADYKLGSGRCDFQM
jgi:hypothetical protein